MLRHFLICDSKAVLIREAAKGIALLVGLSNWLKPRLKAKG